MSGLVISVSDARKILDKKSEGMSDEEIEFVIEKLDLIAKDALKLRESTDL